MNSLVGYDFDLIDEVEVISPVEQFENIEEYVKIRVMEYTGLAPLNVYFSNNVLRIIHHNSIFEESATIFEALIFNQLFKETKGKFKDIGLNPYELIYLLKWLD